MFSEEYVYDRSAVPGVELGPRVNCQSLVHLYYKDVVGIDLPMWLWSKELFEDSTMFGWLQSQPVLSPPQVPQDKLQNGDIMFWTNKEYWDPKELHLSVWHEGEVIHANNVDNGIGFWTLEQMFDRYSVLASTKRLFTDSRI